MTKEILIEMFKLIKNHCDDVKGGCHRCEIKKECDEHFRKAPTYWEIESEAPNV